MAVKATAVNNDQWKRFLQAPSEATPRIIGRSYGPVGTGKTHFWLTSPGPIVVLSFDRGLEGVVEQFSEVKPIYLKEYDWAPTAIGDGFTQDDASLMRDEFELDFAHACTVARTVIVDKESDAWEVFRYAEFGAPKADVPRDFEALNKRYKRVFSLPKKLTINFGVVQAVKDDWTGATKKSGTQSAWGFREMDALVHVDIAHYRDANADGAKRFGITLGKVRGPAALTLPDTTWTGLDMPTLGQMMFPSTEAEDWGVE